MRRSCGSAHEKKLEEMKAMSTFTPTFIALHNFLLWNQRDALVGAKDTMLVLGKYHSRDIYEWEGGSCSFHQLVKCS